MVAGLTCESIGAITNSQRTQYSRMGDNHAHGPNGDKRRPVATGVNALHVAHIATGEVVETYVHMAKRKGGLKGLHVVGIRAVFRKSRSGSSSRQWSRIRTARIRLVG